MQGLPAPTLFSLVEILPLALFSLVAMASFQPLQALNKNSARLATFAVRSCRGRVASYTFTKKSTGAKVTQWKFETWLVGTKPEEYCIGFVRGSKQMCLQMQKNADGAVWSLSKVALDTWTDAKYISTPITYRVDLANSNMKQLEESSLPDMPKHPVPPRTVADVSRITTSRGTDLIAIVKDVSADKRRTTKTGDAVCDITLVDSSLAITGNLASIKVSLFGEEKIERVSLQVGQPMAFFNLSADCSRHGKQFAHYAGEVMLPAPECEKTTALRNNETNLRQATNVEMLSTEFTPTHKARDVSGRQPLSCAAFLDFTSERPEEALPEVSQLMWVHVEEPERSAKVAVAPDRIWYRVQLRDISGSCTVGVPQRIAFILSGCKSKQEFDDKHLDGDLNMPLLCHARVSRQARRADASQPGTFHTLPYMNHTLEAIEPVSWNHLSAPNAAYNDVLHILDNCPEHDQGIVFAFLRDIRPDPIYGFCLEYKDSDGAAQPVRYGPKGVFVAALVASESKSKREKIADDAYKVVTSQVKDIADGYLEEDGKAVLPTDNYTLVGYCTADNLPSFVLDPPRGKPVRVALVFFLMLMTRRACKFTSSSS